MENVLIILITLLSLGALGVIVSLIILWQINRKISKSSRQHGCKPDSTGCNVKDDNYDYPEAHPFPPHDYYSPF
jgi:hypothetical protein